MATRRRGRPRSGGSREVGVPFASREHRVAPPDRVHGDALVQVEAPHAVHLGDVDELVAGFLLVDEPRLGANLAGRDGEQRAERGGDDEPAAAEQDGARRARRRPRRRAASAAFRSPGSGRARRGTCPAGCRPSRARTGARRPSPRPARRRSRGAPRTARPCRAGSPAARRAASTAKNDPIAAPAETWSSPSTETSRNGPGREGHDRDQHACREHDAPEDARARMAVRDPPAEPVAERERARARGRSRSPRRSSSSRSTARAAWRRRSRWRARRRLRRRRGRSASASERPPPRAALPFARR